MLQFLLIFLFAFLTACQPAPGNVQPGDVQPSDVQPTSSEPQAVKDASLSGYHLIKKDLMDSAEGGEVNFYMDGEQVQKIEALRMGETGKLFEEYYFKDGVLDSAVITQSSYNRPIYWDEQMAAESGDTEAFDPAKTQVSESTYDYRAGDSSPEALHWKESAETLMEML